MVEVKVENSHILLARIRWSIFINLARRYGFEEAIRITKMWSVHWGAKNFREPWREVNEKLLEINKHLRRKHGYTYI